jgi:hypothetical protein
MKILVAVPSISHEMAQSISNLSHYLSIESFEKTQNTLDVFIDEMKDVAPENFWTLNVPHWPIEERGTKGVAGPGKPHQELFVPGYLQKTLAPLCGKYDKWRPYPAAKPLSPYSINMAKRFAKKRCKMFHKIVDDMPFETLFYVEHGPASLAHLSKKTAVEIANEVIAEANYAASKNPRYDIVIFSPYGVGNTPGFVVSKRMDAKLLSNWTAIRQYLNGQGIAGCTECSTG